MTISKYIRSDKISAVSLKLLRVHNPEITTKKSYSRKEELLIALFHKF